MANEKRMIDMDVAIERARASDNIVRSSIWETCEVVEFLEDCPIVDAVEVVHGRWIQSEPGYRLCSHCMADVAIYSGHRNYCPNCGAKMDGDGNDI